jgi:hypothetical protein
MPFAEFPGAHHDVLNESAHRDVSAAIVAFTRSVSAR